ncbi:hypothetical protein [Paenibacillus methanolicus]|uniref:Uncharacterized protein n=1 Tax=Paenibacillus methanolicus TaxID=582686 RepID=A0A5S5CJ44_9BACL|nr:hypothetical protein [Paenibacillus methanolicus]TYP79770.1 hypothetical protein BCM02_101891 [Paenibacillus methanolicus]
MPFSTGTITNTRATGTASSTIVLSTRNLNTSAASTITVQIFATVNSTTFYTAYVDSFVIAANSYNIRTYVIGGNVAYEVQVNSSASQVLFSVFGIDEFGNMVPNQGRTQPELSFIAALSPII